MPQLENGYTRIADEIIENVYKMRISGSKLRIILVVWRYTYGFNRKSTDLSISFISAATGIHKQQVKTELKELIHIGLLIVTKYPTFNSSRELSFNKNFNYEELKTVTGSENSTPTGSETTTTTGSEFTPQDKEPINNTKDSVIDVVKYYKENCLLLPQAKKITDQRKKAINARITDYGFDEVLKTLDKANISKFLTEKKDSNGKAKTWLKFDWIFNPNNFVKIYEGNYTQEETKKFVNPKKVGQMTL